MSTSIVEYSGYAVSIDTGGFRSVSPGDEIYDYESFRLFTDGPPPEPVASPEEVATAAMLERDKRLSLAAIRIAPLQDAVDLEESTPDEVALLKKWKQYRVTLSRISQQPGWPVDVAWPEIPE